MTLHPRLILLAVVLAVPAVASADDPKVPPVPVPKADKTVWKHDAGHFEKTGDGKWVERTATGEFTWTEKGTDPIKLVLEDTTRKLMVEIKAASALVRTPGQKLSEGKTLKGEWVKAEAKSDKPDKTDKPDPKAAGKYTEVAKLPPEKVEGVVAISPDGTQVARKLGKLLAAEYGVVEVGTGKVVQKWKEEGSTTAAAWSADGKTFATYTLGQVGKDGKPSRVVVRDAATWEEKAAFELTGFHSSLALSADGSRVACASGADIGKGVAQVFDVGTKKEVFSKPTTGVYEGLFLSADGKTVGGCGGGAKGEFALFDVATGKEKAGYSTKGKVVMSADAGAVAEFDYTAQTGMILNVWEGKAKSPKTIKVKLFQAAAAVFLDDAKHIAVAGHSFTKPEGDVVKVFNLKTLAEVDSFLVGKETNLGSSLYLSATPDSSRLLTFGLDKNLRVWRTPFGEKKDDKKPAKP